MVYVNQSESDSDSEDDPVITNGETTSTIRQIKNKYETKRDDETDESSDDEKRVVRSVKAKRFDVLYRVILILVTLVRVRIMFKISGL